MSTATITTNRQEMGRITSIHETNTADYQTLNETVQNPLVENHDEPRRPANNPAWWPTNHRRIPGYLPARYHPEWHELTDNSAIMSVVILVLFGGCHLIAVGEPPESPRALF
jgi:hypothetical protein